LRLIDFVYHSTLGLRAIKKKKGLREARALPLPSESDTYKVLAHTRQS